MKLLLDEFIPRKLSVAFPDSFDVQTVPEMGWAGTKNGKLLQLAASQQLAFTISPCNKAAKFAVCGSGSLFKKPLGSTRVASSVVSKSGTFASLSRRISIAGRDVVIESY